jgi:hypothetical protein
MCEHLVETILLDYLVAAGNLMQLQYYILNE